MCDIFSFFEFKVRTRSFGHTRIPGHWTQKLGAGLWMLDAGLWMLDSGRWSLDTGSWMLHYGRWALDTGYWTLSLTVIEQNQNPVSDFASLNY